MKPLIFVLFLGVVYGAPSGGAGGLCEVCHLLVGEVQQLVAQGHTQTTIAEYVSDICSGLPNTEKDVCQLFISDNSDTFFNRLYNDLTPYELCGKLPEICPASTAPVEEEEDVGQPIEDIAEITGNPLECELCKLAVLGVDKLIKTNRSAGAINETLEKFCNSLPGEVGELCHKIEPAILKGFSQGFEPEVVCKFATLCAVPGDMETVDLPCEVCHVAMDAMGIEDTESICSMQRRCLENRPQPKLATEDVSDVQDTLECQICKFAVQAIDTLVGENKTAATINATLEDLCNRLPGELKDSCVSAEPEILKAILGGIDPSKACDFLTLCNDNGRNPLTSKFITCPVCKATLESIAGERGLELCHQFEEVCPVTERPVQETSQEDSKCELCKFVVGLLDEKIVNNASIGKINETLYSICDMLPQEYKGLCLGIIPQIESVVAKGMDPNGSCYAIDFCTASSAPVSLHEVTCDVCSKMIEAVPLEMANKIARGVCHHACPYRKRRSVDDFMTELTSVIKEAKVNNLAECELCKVAVRTLDGLAGENATVAEVNKTAIEICQRLTGIQLQEMCMQELPTIVKLLQTGLDPDMVCKDLGVCTDDNAIEMMEDPAELNETPDNKVGTLACDLCEGVVQLLDKLVENNATDEKINETLNRICTGLPSGALKDLCLQEAPVILKALEDGVDPEKACTLAKLCDGKDHTIMDSEMLQLVTDAFERESEAEPSGNVKDVKCDVCKGLIQEIDSILGKNASVEKINQTIYQLCNEIPGTEIKQLCLSIAPDVVDAVKNGVDPTSACTSIGLCNAMREPSQIYEMAKVHYDVEEDDVDIDIDGLTNLKDLKCDICEAVVKEVDTIIGKNASVAKINETIYNICDKLPGELKDTCIKIAPDLVDAIKNGLDPTAACEAIGVCDAVQKPSQIYEMAKVQYDVQEDAMHVDIDGLTNLKDLKCDICEAVVKEVDTIIGKNTSVAKINETIYNICDKLPGELKDTCIKIAPDLVDAIKNGLDPTAVCEAIGVCDAVQKSQRTKKIRNISKKIVYVLHQEDAKANENLKDLECEICVVVVEEVDKIVGKNASIAKINETIYEVCSKLPGELNDMCLQSAPGIVDALARGLNPNSACDAIGICNGVQQSPRMKKKATVQKKRVYEPKEEDVKIDIDDLKNLKDLKCEVCKGIVQELDALIEKNSSVAKVNETIYIVCGKLPEGEFKDLCDQYAPYLVDAVMKGVDPTEACETVGLCSAINSMSVKQESMEEYDEVTLDAVANLRDTKCEICKAIVQELDILIEKNASVAKVNETIYEVCNDLPGELKDLCFQYAPDLVDAVESGIDPATACTKVGLCAAEKNLSERSKTLVLGQAEDEVLLNSDGVGNLEDLECDVCKGIIKELDVLVGQNASLEKINETLYGICSELKGAFQDLCLQYAPQLMLVLEDGVDPTAACDRIGLCDRVDARAPTPLRIVEEASGISIDDLDNVGDIKCEVCELIIKGLDTIIGKNASAEKINSTIYELCDELSGSPKMFCLLVAPTVVKEIEAGADPMTACKDLKLCTSTDVHIAAKHTATKARLECRSCINALQPVFEDVSDNYVKVQRSLQGVCNNLPPVFRSNCLVLVDSGDEGLFKMFLNNYTPVLMCEMAGCQETKEPSTSPNKTY